MKTITLPWIDAVKFDLGQIVYRKIIPDAEGMVTGIMFRPTGVVYYCTFSNEEDEVACYDIELTTEKNYSYADS